ncbi:MULTISPECIES: late competence development ComFB family protein [Vibrio]|uniref:late competence development ComFB family protein n=1 Tax=Vibrio TaxID=662 RepID=UPI00237CBF2D|nr:MULTISPECIES: late competence development ComFB family protein [Vibrio]MDE1263788.1 late competence development ComFB family protein [Vibrio aestuarianus]MDE1295716.1 late competence development ComFB family protein [Vibrio aestuarianus]MDE1315625.1 late competence development ComFB family protein [Vibrio aestuarianus]MDF9400930.1 competence protein ComFB [Vibrio sp. 1180_3]
MQISADVHNYMETLVGRVLAEDFYIERFNNEQLADLACLALGQLRPIYIRHDIDFLSALPEERLVELKDNARIAVESAQSLIINDRRQHREDAIPVIVGQLRFDDDIELEWFEKPLIESNKR